MAGKRRIGQAGNYAAPVDTEGMDPEMKATLGLGRGGREKRPVVGGKLTKTEAAYLKSRTKAGGGASAAKAIEKVRSRRGK